ncbi:hypothetical protein HYC85_030647 [Camellia sinensis]|uniref:Disease resistance protein winged helix domain-containing protein n=1 Tax=Camellia sinensis TaxID=4442 RepID=A0A7J7G5C3_CAMSI|nr:hypothetical protein HYC85_030647 [Camellia sinensis]
MGCLHGPDPPICMASLLNTEAFWPATGLEMDSGVLDTNMEAIWRKMVKLCAGLPLGIIVLGGLLATKHTLREWEVVYQNIRSHKWSDDPIQHDNGVSTVLALSYHDLPYQLKPCFLYFGHFPEDYRIDAERLYHLWIGDGIIVDDDRVGDETIMDVAKCYLGALAQRCMVQVQVEEYTQRINYCRIHDLMLELIANLCSIELNSHLKYFKLLRNLDLDAFEFDEKSVESIGNLISLRYLSFRGCLIPKWHSSICKLKHLQNLGFTIEKSKNPLDVDL